MILKCTAPIKQICRAKSIRDKNREDNCTGIPYCECKYQELIRTNADKLRSMSDDELNEIWDKLNKIKE